MNSFESMCVSIGDITSVKLDESPIACVFMAYHTPGRLRDDIAPSVAASYQSGNSSWR